MIKSIKFDVSKGYISENKELKKRLKDRTFEFDRFKVNIIFGPNGSGKTTILKALSAHTFTGDPERGGLDNIRDSCSDGWTTLMKVSPLKSRNFMSSKKPDETTIRDYIDSTAKNVAEVVWDGTPVYYHNFGERMTKSNGNIGMLGTSDDAMQNLAYGMQMMDMYKTHSAGENIKAGINYTLDELETFHSFEELMASEEKLRKQHNDVWQEYLKAQAEYIRKVREDSLPLLSDIDKKEGNTVLFDEIDQNCDINITMIILFNILPKVVLDNKAQVIVVCHNPIVLCDEIYKSENYNIIEMDPKYTKMVRKYLTKITFSDK